MIFGTPSVETGFFNQILNNPQYVFDEHGVNKKHTVAENVRNWKSLYYLWITALFKKNDFSKNRLK